MTVTEIAKKAGVSIGTVDRVLHNRGRVSEETRAKVQKIIEESRYQANPLARHLKKNLKYRIGVLIPELAKESTYWKLIYDGIAAAAATLSAFSFELELFEFVRPVRSSFLSAFERMTSSDCSAWIIAPVMQDETLVLLMDVENPVPYAFIDCPLPGACPLTTVAQDPFQGGVLAGRLMDLVSHSGGPFAVIRPYNEAFNLNERARGFASWFDGRPGVIVRDVVCQENEPRQMLSALESLLQELPDLRGVFIVSSMVHTITDYLCSRGFRSGNPQTDVRIIGYDLVPPNRMLLSTGKIDCLISQRPEEQGRLVMQQLYRCLVLEDETRSDIAIPMDIFFRENLQG
ncbi:MAG: LacI family DNA-binding transcriptional regulator [Spirochaetales bacterium]|nr:LacI family DNA-binding transcriptional regulator [Spirochaetales bacterium]